MDLCVEHLSGGGDLPCAWPDCQKGTKADSWSRAMGQMRSVRAWLDSYDGRRRYFWRLADNPWWLAQAQLWNYERSRVHRPLFLNKYVYHYTTLDALQKIVESQELWLTDYAYLNDSSEVHHGLKLAKEVLATQLASLAPDERQVFEALFEPQTETQPRICVACFSFERDSLSQWRGYRRDTVGVAIGIEPFEFLNEAGGPTETTPTSVIYDDDIKVDLLRGFQHDWTGLFRLDRESNDARWLEAYSILPRSHFFELLSTFKDKAFRDEREFRFVYREDPQTFENLPNLRASKRFRVSGELMIPYTTTKDLIDAWSKFEGARARHLRLHEVVVGPHPLARTAAAGIREFLNHHNYHNVGVNVSGVTLR